MYAFFTIKERGARSCAAGCLDPGRASYGSLILSPLEPFNVPLLGKNNKFGKTYMLKKQQPTNQRLIVRKNQY